MLQEIEAVYGLRIPSTDKHVLVAMLTMTDERRVYSAANATLAKRTGLSVSGVKVSIVRLREEGLIRLANTADHPMAGKGMTHHYKIILDVEPGHVVTTPSHEVTSHDVTTPGHHVARGSHQVSATTNYSPSPSEKDEEHTSTSTPLRRRASSEAERLRVYFVQALVRAKTEYGAEFVGVTDKTEFRRHMQRLLDAGISGDRLRRMIDVYVSRPSAWNTHVHPSRDFVSNGTQTRLVNLVRETGNTDTAEPVTEVVTRARDYSGMTKEERFYWMRYDALPSWTKAEWDKIREGKTA